ncbi:MAG: glycosyltransferase family 4 protein [Candidatus Baldrarchaeia archaeon]
MKIAIVFPGFSEYITGGAGGLLLHLCDELIKMGNEVTLITTEIGEIWKPLIPSKLKIITTGSTFKTSNRDANLLLQHYNVAMLYKYLSDDFDIINVHNYPSPLAPAIAKKWKNPNTPVVYQCNEPPRFLYDLYEETIKNSPPLKRAAIRVSSPFIRKLDAWSINYVDEIITISKFMQKYIKQVYGRDSVFIMPGIEVDRFRPDINGEDIRGKYARDDDFVILTSNVLHIRKRTDILIRAIPYVLKKHKNVKVIITGEGPEKQKLEYLIKSLKLEKNVFLTGFVPYEELPKYYAACDVFVFTAIREPQIGSPAEALATGKPVIAPNNGSPAETIIEGKTGFLYKPLDHVDLANKIIWCINNRSYLIKMSTSCRKWVEENMTWKKMAEETYTIFKDLLGV